MYLKSANFNNTNFEILFAVDFCNFYIDTNTINKICTTTAKKRKNHVQSCNKSINIQVVKLIPAFFGSKNILDNSVIVVQSTIGFLYIENFIKFGTRFSNELINAIFPQKHLLLAHS